MGITVLFERVKIAARRVAMRSIRCALCNVYNSIVARASDPRIREYVTRIRCVFSSRTRSCRDTVVLVCCYDCTGIYLSSTLPPLSRSTHSSQREIIGTDSSTTCAQTIWRHKVADFRVDSHRILHSARDGDNGNNGNRILR